MNAEMLNAMMYGGTLALSLAATAMLCASLYLVWKTHYSRYTRTFISGLLAGVLLVSITTAAIAVLMLKTPKPSCGTGTALYQGRSHDGGEYYICKTTN